MTQCNYLFGQLSPCSRPKKIVDPTFLRRDTSILTCAPHTIFQERTHLWKWDHQNLFSRHPKESKNADLNATSGGCP